MLSPSRRRLVATAASVTVVALLAARPLLAADGIEWVDPRAADTGPWTTVHLKAPVGARLCITGQLLPVGTATVWVQPGGYSLCAFGDKQLRMSEWFNTENAPPDTTIAIASPPDLMGTWTGDMDGMPVTLVFERVACEQVTCLADPSLPDGVGGRMTGTAPDGETSWQLVFFEWIAYKQELSFSALLGGATGDVDRTFGLSVAEDGSLIGTYVISDDDEIWFAEPGSDSESDPDSDSAVEDDGTCASAEHPIVLRRVVD